jgi:hypothetical protein
MVEVDACRSWIACRSDLAATPSTASLGHYRRSPTAFFVARACYTLGQENVARPLGIMAKTIPEAFFDDSVQAAPLISRVPSFPLRFAPQIVHIFARLTGVVCLAHVIRKCLPHGRLHVGLEGKPTNRAVFQVASVNQMWPKTW